MSQKCHERNDALIGALGAAADRHRKTGSTAIIGLADLLEALGADVPGRGAPARRRYRARVQ